MSLRPKLFYGWWIVLATSLYSLYIGGTFFYTFTVFFDPIKDSLQATTTAMSLAFMMQRLEGGLIAPIAGYLFDRIGPRKIGLVGTCVSATGFVLMSRIHSLPLFYVSYLLIALGFSFGLGGVGRAVIANWFIRWRGRAMAGQMVGFGLSGSIAPLMVMLINHLGWRPTLIGSGIGLLLIGIPASLMMVHRPEDKGLLPDGETPAVKSAISENPASRPAVKEAEVNFSAKAALLTPAFWAMAIGFTMGNFGQSSLMVYEMPALKAAGISRETAALVIMAITLTSVAGRVGFGWLVDIYNKRLTAVMTIALQSIGILMFGLISSDRIWLIPLFLLFYAPGYGGTLVTRPAMQGDYFGRKAFGTIQGLAMGVSGLAAMAGPVIAGRIYDVTDSYRLAFLIFSIASATGCLIILLFARKPRVREPAAEIALQQARSS